MQLHRLFDERGEINPPSLPPPRDYAREAGRTIYHEEILGRFRDAVLSSLSNSRAAAVLLTQLGGVPAERLIAASIDLLREQAESHAGIVAELRSELAELLDRDS